MGKTRYTSDGATIVGGRPMHRAVQTKDLPQGVEQVLTLAALDPRFCRAVEADPVEAAAARGIRLDSVEADLLRAIPGARLVEMAKRTVIPTSSGRRDFVKVVSASVLAMITGNAVLLCSGCTGADAWVDSLDADSNKPGKEYWIELGGYPCFVYLPSNVVADATQSVQVMVALHGDSETCLASAKRWYAAADRFKFALIAPNCSVDGAAPVQNDALVAALRGMTSDFRGLYAGARTFYLSSRGSLADVAWTAGFVVDTTGYWKGVAMLGGVPQGDWINNADGLLQSLTRARSTCLFYVEGRLDAEFAQQQAFASAVTARFRQLDGGNKVQTVQAETSSTDTVLDFSQIWEWLSTH
jgi:hypothetical protein